MSHRLLICIALLTITFLVGVGGFKLLGGPEWTLLDAVYMTVISVTTVGYGETHALDEAPQMRLFTIAFLMVSYGVVIVASSTITAFLVEGELNSLLRRRKMSKDIKNLTHHYIICGAGETGHYIIEELLKTGSSFVVIEQSDDRIEKLEHVYGNKILILQGDATEDETLLEAGIERAHGILITLESDKDTVFVTLTARQLSREIRIVARGVDSGARQKLLKAGADSVVLPNYIGGMRIASEMLRPEVVSFLDEMLRNPEATTRFEQVDIGADSELDGKSIGEAHLVGRVGMLIVAYKGPGETLFRYNPKAETRLEGGGVVVVLSDS